jgi:hypothetical protein
MGICGSLESGVHGRAHADGRGIGVFDIPALIVRVARAAPRHRSVELEAGNASGPQGQALQTGAGGQTIEQFVIHITTRIFDPIALGF